MAHHLLRDAKICCEHQFVLKWKWDAGLSSPAKLSGICPSLDKYLKSPDGRTEIEGFGMRTQPPKKARRALRAQSRDFRLRNLTEIFKSNSELKERLSDLVKPMARHISFPVRSQEVSDDPDEGATNSCCNAARILIVDDNELVGLMLAQTLRRRGYKAQYVTCPLVALQHDLSDVDLFFTDMIMPVMDGNDFGSRVKNMYPATPLIAYSGSGETRPDPALFHAALRKPINPDQLAAKIAITIDKTTANRILET
jgi:CheY-like chemotaxis protein